MSNLSLIRDPRSAQSNLMFQGRRDADANRVRPFLESLEERTVPCHPVLPKYPVLPPAIIHIQPPPPPVVLKPAPMIAGYSIPLFPQVAAPLQRFVLARPALAPAKITVTQLTEADGTPDNKSRLVVPFTQPIQLKNANPNQIILSATVLDPATNRNKKVFIPVLSVSIDQAHNSLIVNTGQQVPRGATLTIAKGTVANCYGQILNAQSTTIRNSTLSPNDFIMVNRGFKPTNVNLFTNDAFANASVATNAVGNTLTEAQASQQLSSFLIKKISLGQISRQQYTETMKLFNAASTKQIIPEPALRAALLSLQGTASASAINAVLTSNNQSGKPFAKIYFDASLNSSLPAEANSLSDGSRIIKVNANLKAEAFQALGAELAHEVMHQDNVNGQNEEILAESAKTFAWAQMLLVDPKLAQINTILVRSLNTDLLAVLNSGNRSFSKVGVTSAPQIQTGATANAPKVFVGGNEGFRSFEDYIRKIYAFIGATDTDTPGNAYLNGFLSALTKTKVTNGLFNRTSLQLEDSSQQVLSTAQVLQLAKALKLSV